MDNALSMSTFGTLGGADRHNGRRGVHPTAGLDPDEQSMISRVSTVESEVTEIRSSQLEMLMLLKGMQGAMVATGDMKQVSPEGKMD